MGSFQFIVLGLICKSLMSTSMWLNETSSKYEDEGSLSFFLLGDWGKGGSTGKYGSSLSLSLISSESEFQTQAKSSRLYQMEVATAMRTYASNKSEIQPAFVLALGDNFYANGVASSTDPLWSNLWKDVYLAEDSELNIPWYPVFGNHDYGGSTSAQIQRYLDHTDDDIWMFESPCYRKTFSILGGGDENGTVVVIFIDTTTLAPSENKCCNEQGGISLERQQVRISDQLHHIEMLLNDSTRGAAGRPTWLFVAGHYPVFSAGTNGDTKELQTYLQPLLEQYKVDAYFSGHDHMSEHLLNNGVDYFVAGAGSMTDTVRRYSGGQLLWAGESYAAFAVVEATTQSFSVNFIDTANVKRYTAVKEKPSAANRRPTSAPVIHPSAQPSSAPTSEPSSKPSLVPTNHAAASSGSKDDRSFLSAISNIFAEGTRSPTVLAAGSVLGASLMVLLVYAAYSRNGKRSFYKAVVISSSDKKRKSPTDGHLAMVALRGEASDIGGGDEDDSHDEEEGNPGRHTFMMPPFYKLEGSVKRGQSDPPRPTLTSETGRPHDRDYMSVTSQARGEVEPSRRLNPSVAAYSSGSASGSSPSDLTQSDGDGIQPELRRFESELRLKLFDVLAQHHV